MNYKEFMTKLIKGEVTGVYLFDSKEKFLNDTIIQAARQKVSFVDFNLVDIKGQIDIESIKNAYETYPVMEDKKIIIWRDIDLSKNSLKDYEEILGKLNKDIEDFPTYTIFLIFSEKSPFKGKFYKKVKEFGTIVEIPRLSKAELESFIGKRFVRNGKKIQKSLVGEIVNRFSYLDRDSDIDLYQIVNTVDKIIANSSDSLVKESDVYEHLDEVLNINIFALTDALSNKNLKLATTTYQKMLRSEEDLFMIFHMIVRQIRNLIGVKLLVDKKNDAYIMKNVGIGNFELRKLKSFVNNFRIEDLFAYHSSLFDMEVRQKSTNFDMAVELMLFIKLICK